MRAESPVQRRKYREKLSYEEFLPQIRYRLVPPISYTYSCSTRWLCNRVYIIFVENARVFKVQFWIEQENDSPTRGGRDGMPSRPPLVGLSQTFELFAACCAFDDDFFADAALNGRQFISRALNDRAFEPVMSADDPPDADDEQRTQHRYRRVVEVTGINWIRRWKHEQDRDQHDPDHGNSADWLAPRA